MDRKRTQELAYAQLKLLTVTARLKGFIVEPTDVKVIESWIRTGSMGYRTLVAIGEGRTVKGYRARRAVIMLSSQKYRI